MCSYPLLKRQLKAAPYAAVVPLESPLSEAVSSSAPSFTFQLAAAFGKLLRTAIAAWFRVYDASCGSATKAASRMADRCIIRKGAEPQCGSRMPGCRTSMITLPGAAEGGGGGAGTADGR